MRRHLFRENRSRFTRLRAVLAGGLVLGVGVTATLAPWTDEEHAAGGFAAGTFSIVGSANGTDYRDHPSAPGAALNFTLAPNAMVPGATVYAVYSVKTKINSVSGSVQLTAHTGNESGLGAYLEYGVNKITGTTCNAAAFIAGTPIIALKSKLTAGAAAKQTLAEAGATPVNYCLLSRCPAPHPMPHGAPRSPVSGPSRPPPIPPGHNVSRRVRGFGRFLSGTLLNLSALGGLICVVLVVLALVFNATLIMFKTGSMSPTIPAGSLSLVREMPASEIRVGDVVTVDRPAALPITHRVTTVVQGPWSAERVITMKGDANEAEDPFPYTVSTVRIVLFSVPHLAYGVSWLSNPWVLGVLTLGASALVTRAFWPRNHEELDETAQEVQLHSAEESGNGSHLGMVLLIAPLALGLAMSGHAPETTEDVFTSGHLTMTSIGNHAAMAQLTPGEQVQWQVGITAADSDPGDVKIELLGAGNALLGLNATIRSCDRRWTNGTCGGETDQINGPRLVAVDGTKRQLTAMSVEEERWLLFDLWLPKGSARDAGVGLVSLQVHASGSGDDVISSPGPLGTLPPTGANPLLPLLAAAVAIVVGLVLAGAAKKRMNRE